MLSSRRFLQILHALRLRRRPSPPPFLFRAHRRPPHRPLLWRFYPCPSLLCFHRASNLRRFSTRRRRSCHFRAIFVFKYSNRTICLRHRALSTRCVELALAFANIFTSCMSTNVISLNSNGFPFLAFHFHANVAAKTRRSPCIHQPSQACSY